MQRPDGQEITYNPARLSGVNVYRESNRMFAEGDRIQFRAPFTEHRIANGELGSIGKITEEELTVALDRGREVSFEPDKFRHLDHGYAVTSYSSQSQTVDRVLVNADANESDLLLNQRMGYVAVSRAREEAMIFTNSIEQLSAALDRKVDKETAIEALRQNLERTRMHEREETFCPSVGTRRVAIRTIPAITMLKKTPTMNWNSKSGLRVLSFHENAIHGMKEDGRQPYLRVSAKMNISDSSEQVLDEDQLTAVLLSNLA